MLESKRNLAIIALVFFIALVHFAKQAYFSKNEALLVLQVEEWEDLYSHKEKFSSVYLKIKKHKYFGPYLEVRGFVPNPEFLSDIKAWLRINSPPFRELRKYEDKPRRNPFFELTPLLVVYKVTVEE